MTVSSRPLLALPALALGLLAPAGLGQSVLYSFDGDSPEDRLGFSVSGAGGALAATWMQRTARAQAQGFTINVDGTSLSAGTLHLSGEGFFSSSDVQTFDLAAGPYTIFYGTGTAPSPTIAFDVSASGTIDFDAALDGFLSGRGTSTLVLQGVTIDVDMTPLSYGAGIFGGVGILTTTEVASLTLLPGAHTLRFGTGAHPGPEIVYTVSAAGTVDFDGSLDGFVSGRGTVTLVVQGLPIDVDLTGLSYLVGIFGDVGILTTTEVASLTLLPGAQTLRFSGGANIVYTVSGAGTVDFDGSLDGFVSGRGTATLIVQGLPIFIDATALSQSVFQFGGVGFLPTDTVASLALMPGPHLFRATDDGFDFIFCVTLGGTVDYDMSLDPVVSGRGTSTLVVGALEPAVQLQNLIDDLGDINLPAKLKAPLTAILNAALIVLTDDLDSNDVAACGQIGAFIALVAAHSGGEIAESDADDLIGSAQQIRDDLGCQ